VTEPKEPMRVVDRRWWAKPDAESDTPDSADDRRERKPTVVEELEQQLTRSNEQLQAVLTEHRRAAEEFEQVKLRLRRDTAREVERGRRTVLAEMLDVMDNLDRALAAARGSGPGTTSTLLRGVELVREQFLGKLEGFGVQLLPALHSPFDPQVHEAVSMTPVADPAMHGVVIAVAAEGYVIGDELLRPASVVVGTHG